MLSKRFFRSTTHVSLLAGALLGCAPGSTLSDSQSATSGSGGAGGGGGALASHAGGHGGDVINPTGGAGGSDACVTDGSAATLTRKAVDVIFLVDNSVSMRRQVEGVQKSINASFAKILETYKLDYRVIVVSEHGDASASTTKNSPICIEAPLSGVPVGGCASPPAEPAYNPPRFFQYSAQVRPKRALCTFLDGYDRPDELGLAPGGWSAWLREGAFKSIVVISAGRAECATSSGDFFGDGNTPAGAQTLAASFEAKLRALSPSQFGASEATRNERFYSLVTMAANDPASAPYPATDPLITETCDALEVNTGLGYQALSRLTGGARFPLCNPDAFQNIFETIAKDLVSGSPVECDFAVPEPPEGETLDLSRVAVKYTPSDGGEPALFGPVPSASECVPKGFYIESGTVHLCPETCAEVQSDDAAKIGVLFDCQVNIR